MKLVIAPEAAEDIEVVTRWWAANRPKAPGLFTEELFEAFERILATPSMGGVVRGSRPAGVRWTALPRCRYLVYYRADSAADELRVLRVWHMSRGKAPKL